LRARIFIDYWNFQLAWKERAGRAGCDWRLLPGTLTSEGSAIVTQASLGALSLEETRVYAGYEAGRENQLKGWLHNFLDRQPGIRVFTSERHWRKQGVHCRTCDTEHHNCPSCQAPLGRAAEKTIDARIVTDIVGLAWEGAYDVAIPVSSDKDFIPAVEHVQAKNFKVVNACWSRRGNELAKVCWASFEIDRLIPGLKRPDRNSE
jgi:uncharacterized LabA/DUF88 family protein